jgi:hypothetical protein
MHLLQIHDHRDLHRDDLGRRDVELHQLMDLSCDMDLMLVHLHRLLHRDVVQILDALDRLHLQDVEHLDVQQNLDVEHLDVEHLDELHPLVAAVDAELRHLLRMDYFLDVVDVELPHPQRMDCCQVVVHLERKELLAQQAQQVHLALLCMQLPLMQQLALLHVMP